MNLRRKGQGAMEYLMTYGWAILVVMIVGIVMWQLGIFNMGGTAVTSSGFARIKPQLSAIAMGADSTSDFLFTNGAGGTITVGSILITVDDGGAGNSVVGALPVDTTVAAGDNIKFSNVAVAVNGGEGDPISMVISINYVINVSGIVTSHTERGTIRGPLE
ncbi:MAG: hypothetical protein ABH950_04950 [Candidatus Altiarchaeota archaeon]